MTFLSTHYGSGTSCGLSHFISRLICLLLLLFLLLTIIVFSILQMKELRPTSNWCKVTEEVTVRTRSPHPHPQTAETDCEVRSAEPRPTPLLSDQATACSFSVLTLLRRRSGRLPEVIPFALGLCGPGNVMGQVSLPCRLSTAAVPSILCSRVGPYSQVLTRVVAADMMHPLPTPSLFSLTGHTHATQAGLRGPSRSLAHVM